MSKAEFQVYASGWTIREMQGLRLCFRHRYSWHWMNWRRLPLRNTTSVRAGVPLMLHMPTGNADLPISHSKRGRCKEKTVINARVEKVLTGRYFGHLFREGRGIIPGRAI